MFFLVRETDIHTIIEARFIRGIRTIRFFAWLFRYFGWFINPLFHKVVRTVSDVGFRYCSNCMYRHSCGACVLFAGGVTPVNVLQVMHDNNIEGLHPNWEGVLRELGSVYEMCLRMKQGQSNWNDKVYRL